MIWGLARRRSAAVRAGCLLDSAEESSVGDATILSRTAILQFIEYELKRSKQLKGTSSLLLARRDPKLADKSSRDEHEEWLMRLKDSLREVDLLGQLSEGLYVVMLPQMNKREAESFRRRIEATLRAGSAFALSIVEINKRDDLEETLAGFGESSGL